MAVSQAQRNKNKSTGFKVGPLAQNRMVRGVGAKVDDIELQVSGPNKKVRTFLADNLTDANLERTVEGASTITLDFLDPERELLGKLPPELVDIQLEGLWFRMVKVHKEGDSVELTFEDREVAYLRKYSGPKKARRDNVTRAEFIYSLIQDVKEEKIPVWIPLLFQVQPIAKQAKTKTSANQSLIPKSATGKAHSKGGINSSAAKKLTVKGAAPTTLQLKIGESTLQVAQGLNAPIQAMIAMIITEIQESDMGGAGLSGNVFEVLPASGWTGDPSDWEAEAKGFLQGYNPQQDGAIAAAQHIADPAVLAEHIQNSGLDPHATYGQWLKEGTAWVRAFMGGSLIASGSTSSSSNQVAKPYEFVVKHQESYWDAIQRLAQEVNWRAFVSAGVFYYDSETNLVIQAPVMLINENSKGINSIDFDYDQGKNDQTLTIDCRARDWAAPPGSAIDVENTGIIEIDGRYVVENIKSSLVNDSCTIIASRPMQPKKEPAPVMKSVSGSSQFGAGGGGSLSGIGGYKFPFKSYQWGRIDMGVDFTGSGGIYAIGNAHVELAVATGWPNGGAGPAGQGILLKLLDGAHAGKFWYTYEGVIVHVQAGDTVRAGQRIASFYPGSSIECGWSDGAGHPLAAPGYVEGKCTNWGLAACRFLSDLEGKKQPCSC